MLTYDNCPVEVRIDFLYLNDFNKKCHDKPGLA